MNDIAAPVVPAAPALPSTPAEAATRLDQLKQDPVFREALMRGGLEQKRTFHDLHELISKGDGVDQAMSGVLPDGIIQDGAQVQMAGTVAMMREIGVRDDVIREALAGYEPSQALIDETTRYKADLMSNPEWRKKFFAGDVEARRQKFLANSILTGGIKEQA